MKRKSSIKTLMVVLCALLISVAMIGCSSTPAPEPTPTPTPEAAGPVIFADLSWDSAQVNNRIAGFILENGYAYEPEYMPGDTIPLLEGLKRGDVDVSMEIWVENQQKPYDEGLAAGQILDLGSNFSDNWQGWLVPTYMIENGDLPADISVEDLPDYWELFKDPEAPSRGRFLNSVPGWSSTGINTEKLATYGLNEYYTDFICGSDAALSGSLAAAYAKGEPWLGYYWAPTWVLGKYDTTPIGEPAYDEEIWNTTRGCAYPSNKVNIAVNADFAGKNPDAVDFLSKYTTTSALANKVLAYMQDNEASTDEAAIWFLQENEDLWTQWVPADIASKVKAALP